MSHYICDAIDDFTRDVEQGNLNRRGWVLQERALSRRTIYFAENQTYWECGEGVRCETLTMMNNKKASFLGDSDFPNSIESSVKGTKILLFQNLYEKYAAMELSFMKDRPMAIRGLEKRLVRTFKTKGGFGMFECYMHRCLLWKRASWSLSPIKTFGEESTPSWSWMAYAGGIRFMDIPFGDMSWADDIYSPWHHDAIADDHAESCEQKVRQPSAIQAPAWELANSFAPENLFLDDRSRSLPQSLRYIVVGTEKSKRPGSNYHRVYVLIVASVSGHGERAYQRVGVGILAEPLICKSKVPAMIRLT
ncbi:hypothetical protein SLS60_001195 [Paraconiothyrium brasiliense]|uniref:Heterokaryon incompatibility domain-containing protein n=1 Tax=Paraconiothyrium brasiliense TaxID=300254 RepID=A0ABR3S8D2_9PLEO